MSEITENNENLIEEFEEEMDDATVITVQIDSTLTQEGEAADAKAVGDALAQKADLSAIVGIDVNGEEADNQGHIILTGQNIPLTTAQGAQMLTEAIQAEQAKTGAGIPLNAEQEAPTIAAAVATLQGQNATTLKMSSAENAATIAATIEELAAEQVGCVKSVNGTTADSNGNVQITEVQFAQNLTSDQNQASVGAFILRTAGGSRSVKNGQAQLQEIRGAMVHTGIVPESITMTVAGTGITAEDVSLDHDDFVAAMTGSGTLELTYTTEWSEDPSDYGITVTGTPESGDSITVVYVEEDRGTITPATPTAFRATGWNLFNSAVGYARVVGYNGRYHVGGSYTALAYSATLNGNQSTITPENNSFEVPGDGFVWVTGYSAANTYITPEWTDWGAGPDVDFEAYREDSISLSTVMTTYFPNGLLAVGTVYDSISLDMNKAISRIERIAYDPDDLADIIESGRAYDADENYIYVVRNSEVSSTISVSGQFTASDHGIEMVDGTEVEPYVVILYGQDLKAKLTNDVVTISQQTLTSAQKTQVRANIEAASATDFNNQFPDNDLGTFANLAAFTSKMDTLINAAPKKSVIGMGYLVYTGGAANIGCPFSGHVIGLGRKGNNNYRAVMVINNGNSADNIAILTKTAGTWASTWRIIRSGSPMTRSKSTLTNLFLAGIHGYVTTSATVVALAIPLLVAADVTTVNITKLSVSIRTVDGGYLGGTAGNDLASYITEQNVYRTQGFIRVILTKSGGWGITNNTPLNGEGTVTLTLS